MHFHRTSLSFMSYVCLQNDRCIRLAVTCKFSDCLKFAPLGMLFDNVTHKCIFIVLVCLLQVVGCRHARFEPQLISAG
jgi:hypothetical protein